MMARKSEQQKAREQHIMEEVQEIYAMFSALRRSYDSLADKSSINESLIDFDGFDANNEDEHLQAAHQLAVIRRDIQAFDSHMPRLKGYQMMVQKWRNSPDRENLTKDDILRIIR